MNSKIFFLLVFVLSIHLYGFDDLKIVSSTKDAVLVEYTPTLIDSAKVTFNNTDFIRLQVLFGSFSKLDVFGAPMFPVRILNIGVPSETGNTFEIIKSDYVDIQGELVPVPRPVKDGKINNEVYEKGEKYSSAFDENIVSFGNYGIMRSIQIQQFVISPVKFDSRTKTIRFYKKIVFKINLSKAAANTNFVNDDFLDGVVANYSVAKNWGINKNAAVAKINAVNSVLSSGRWFRFDAADEGIYKITKSMLASYGIDANTVDPRTIKIYNNGGKIVPEGVTADRPVDLVENAIIVVGEEDGKFDDNDYILFYGHGINFQDYDKSTKRIKTYFNNYSDHNYYWITSGGVKGKRITNKSGLADVPQFTQTTSKAYLYKKDEKSNLPTSGRYFYGDTFTYSKKSITYTNKLDGILPNSTISYNMSFINSGIYQVLLNVEENSTKISDYYLDGKQTEINIIDYSYGVMNDFSGAFTGTLSDSRSNLKFTFNAPDDGYKGYLNYFELSYTRDLKAYNDFVMFYSPENTGIVEYQLNGFSSTNISVFDVSDFANIKLVDKPSLQSGGEYRFRALENSASVIKYIAVNPAAYKTPANPVEVANQNIKGNIAGAKYIIITHSSFLEPAKKLKAYRENNTKEKISTEIFVCDQIFNEFSCGSVDVSAIRDFIKYAYENWTIKPEYVLLFGDGDYDYKNIEKNGKNFVIPWETELSLNQITSYCSDDFYGRIQGDDSMVDIAIGRVNAQTASEADGYVNKVISYETTTDRNTWKNLITLVADDGKTSTGDDGSTHTVPSENLYNSYIPKSFSVNKIYLAAYPAVLTSSGRKKPAVNQAIIDAINAGTLIVNYYGHGNSDVLAHEFVFEKAVTIPQLKNSRYFVLTAATCDFGYYDDPSKQSSTELLVLKPDGGAINAMAAVRPVYGNNNETLNIAFYSNLFRSAREHDNFPISLGKAYYQTKSFNNSENDRKFHLFGDPAVRLQIPQYEVSIDSINGKKCGSDTIYVKALSKMDIKGTVKKPDGTNWSDFNGEGVLTIFDADRTLYLQEINYDISVPGGIIFNGKVSISNGKFSTSCVVPKDISNESSLGKVVLYFYDSKVDGVGSFSKVVFGGSDTLISNDKKGPQIEIYFDDPNMKNSELVNSNSTLIVKLKDEVGLNTTGSGVGHKMEGILNKDENNPIDFSNYFTGDLDSGGKSGKINYKFSNLEPGNYNLKVKAWDVFNNPSESYVDFTVVSGNDLEIRDVYNYPNPFKSSTTFTFQQNFSSPLDVKIKIYTVAGRLIKEIEQKSISEKFVKIDWNGKDQDENMIANGTYLYKINVKTVDGQYTKNVTGKLAILR